MKKLLVLLMILGSFNVFSIVEEDNPGGKTLCEGVNQELLPEDGDIRNFNGKKQIYQDGKWVDQQ